MVFTTVGFYESQAANGLTYVAALADQHVTVSGDDITVPELNNIMGVACLGANLQAARLLSPSLRRMWNLDIHPIQRHANLLSQQAVDEGGAATYNIEAGLGYMDLHDCPVPLVVSEKLNCQIDNSNNNEAQHVVVFLSGGVPTPRKGSIFTIKATSATTLGADAWTNGTLSFGQTLPAGRYAVVGMAYLGATAIAARLVFVGYSWRPGCLGIIEYSDYRPDIFRYGNLGVWGEFEFDQPPTVDFLANAADTAQEVFLDLIQVRAGR